MGELLGFLVVLLMFGIPAGIFFVAAWFVMKRIREMQERAYAPFYETIEKFSVDRGWSQLRVAMYTAEGLFTLRNALPPGLPFDNGYPHIPLYTSTKDNRGMYRYGFILERPLGQSLVRIFALPLYKTQGEIKGVCYAAINIPPTRHWLKLQTDVGPVESMTDHDLESSAFNRKYQLTGSDSKLLTEVFDPVLMEHFSTLRGGTVFVRVKNGFIEVAYRGTVTAGMLDEVQATQQKVQTRFLKAYTAYPEPKA